MRELRWKPPAQAQHGFGTQPADAYMRARRQPYAPDIVFSGHDPAMVGAYHTGDVPYWLGTRDALNLFRQTRICEPVDAALEREIKRALLAFDRSGIPLSDKVGQWPAYDPRTPRMVLLGERSEVIVWPHHDDIPLLHGATCY